jgi:hypothetical protein
MKISSFQSNYNQPNPIQTKNRPLYGSSGCSYIATIVKAVAFVALTLISALFVAAKYAVFSTKCAFFAIRGAFLLCSSVLKLCGLFFPKPRQLSLL